MDNAIDLGRPSSGDVIDLITDDHRRFELLLAQLRDTTMDPATRTLAQVGIEDAAQADQIFSMLMGDLVEPRRQFIEDNARLVSNLDV